MVVARGDDCRISNKRRGRFEPPLPPRASQASGSKNAEQLVSLTGDVRDIVVGELSPLRLRGCQRPSI